MEAHPESSVEILPLLRRRGRSEYRIAIHSLEGILKGGCDGAVLEFTKEDYGEEISGSGLGFPDARDLFDACLYASLLQKGASLTLETPSRGSLFVHPTRLAPDAHRKLADMGAVLIVLAGNPMTMVEDDDPPSALIEIPVLDAAVDDPSKLPLDGIIHPEDLPTVKERFREACEIALKTRGGILDGEI